MTKKTKRPSPDEREAVTRRLAALYPDAVAGYKREGADGLYDADSLFDLIDGGAEVYRALNVQWILSRSYQSPSSADLIVDVFDMGSATDAYAAYHFDMRENASAGVGQESEVEGSALFFWQDRYFVSAVALDDTATTRQALREVAATIAAKIKRQAPLPELVQKLPRANLIESQILLFHGPELLQGRIQLGEGNPLGLGPDTDGLVVRFRDEASAATSEPLTALIVDFPDPTRAEAAETRVRAELFADQAANTPRPSRQGGVAMVQRRADKVLIVQHAYHDKAVATVMDALQNAYAGKRTP